MACLKINFVDKSFVGGCKIAKFVNIFSLESFLLYVNIISVDCLHGVCVCGGGGGGTKSLISSLCLGIFSVVVYCFEWSYTVSVFLRVTGQGGLPQPVFESSLLVVYIIINRALKLITSV